MALTSGSVPHLPSPFPTGAARFSPPPPHHPPRSDPANAQIVKAPVGTKKADVKGLLRKCGIFKVTTTQPSDGFRLRFVDDETRAKVVSFLGEKVRTPPCLLLASPPTLKVSGEEER